jgi:hypothetical protein
MTGVNYNKSRHYAPGFNKRTTRLDVNSRAIVFKAGTSVISSTERLIADVSIKAAMPGDTDGKKRGLEGKRSKFVNHYGMVFDPTATKKPGQYFKHYVTETERIQAMMVDEPYPNFGWVDVGYERNGIKPNPKAKVRRKRYKIDPRTGQPLKSTGIEIKNLGPKIGETTGGNIGSRAARSAGLIVDALGKFRCPPGTPAANRFTNARGEGCAALSVSGLRSASERITEALGRIHPKLPAMVGRANPRTGASAAQFIAQHNREIAAAGRIGIIAGTTAIGAGLAARDYVQEVIGGDLTDEFTDAIITVLQDPTHLSIVQALIAAGASAFMIRKRMEEDEDGPASGLRSLASSMLIDIDDMLVGDKGLDGTYMGSAMTRLRERSMDIQHSVAGIARRTQDRERMIKDLLARHGIAETGDGTDIAELMVKLAEEGILHPDTEFGDFFVGGTLESHQDWAAQRVISGLDILADGMNDVETFQEYKRLKLANEVTPLTELVDMALTRERTYVNGALAGIIEQAQKHPDIASKTRIKVGSYFVESPSGMKLGVDRGRDVFDPTWHGESGPNMILIRSDTAFKGLPSLPGPGEVDLVDAVGGNYEDQLASISAALSSDERMRTWTFTHMTDLAAAQGNGWADMGSEVGIHEFSHLIQFDRILTWAEANGQDIDGMSNVQLMGVVNGFLAASNPEDMRYVFGNDIEDIIEKRLDALAGVYSYTEQQKALELLNASDVDGFNKAKSVAMLETLAELYSAREMGLMDGPDIDDALGWARPHSGPVSSGLPSAAPRPIIPMSTPVPPAPRPLIPIDSPRPIIPMRPDPIDGSGSGMFGPKYVDPDIQAFIDSVKDMEFPSTEALDNLVKEHSKKLSKEEFEALINSQKIRGGSSDGFGFSSLTNTSDNLDSIAEITGAFERNGLEAPKNIGEDMIQQESLVLEALDKTQLPMDMVAEIQIEISEDVSIGDSIDINEPITGNIITNEPTSGLSSKLGIASKLLGSKRGRKILEKIGVGEERQESLEFVAEMAEAFTAFGPPGVAAVLARRGGRDAADKFLTVAVERGWIDPSTAEKAKPFIEKIAPEGLPDDVMKGLEKSADVLASEGTREKAREIASAARERISELDVSGAKDKAKEIAEGAKDRVVDATESLRDRVRRRGDKTPELGSSIPEPSWFPDPVDSTRKRWWDGERYTEHIVGSDGIQGIDADPRLHKPKDVDPFSDASTEMPTWESDTFVTDPISIDPFSSTDAFGDTTSGMSSRSVKPKTTADLIDAIRTSNMSTEELLEAGFSQSQIDSVRKRLNEKSILTDLVTFKIPANINFKILPPTPDLKKKKNSVRLVLPNGSNAAVTNMNGNTNGITIPPGKMKITGRGEDGVLEAEISHQVTSDEYLKETQNNLSLISSSPISENRKYADSLLGFVKEKRKNKTISGARSMSTASKNTLARSNEIISDLVKINNKPFGQNEVTKGEQTMPYDKYAERYSIAIYALLREARNKSGASLFGEEVPEEVSKILEKYLDKQIKELITKLAVDVHNEFDRRARFSIDNELLQKFVSAKKISGESSKSKSISRLRQSRNNAIGIRDLSTKITNVSLINGSYIQKIEEGLREKGTLVGSEEFMDYDRGMELVLRGENAPRIFYGRKNAYNSGGSYVLLNENDETAIELAIFGMIGASGRDSVSELFDILLTLSDGNHDRILNNNGTSEFEAFIIDEIRIEDVEHVKIPTSIFNSQMSKIPENDMIAGRIFISEMLKSRGATDEELKAFFEKGGQVGGGFTPKFYNILSDIGKAEKLKKKLIDLGIEEVIFTNKDGVDILAEDTWVSPSPNRENGRIGLYGMAMQEMVRFIDKIKPPDKEKPKPKQKPKPKEKAK